MHLLGRNPPGRSTALTDLVDIMGVFAHVSDCIIRFTP